MADPHTCPWRPEHEPVSAEAQQDERRFVYEHPDRTFLSGPGSRLGDLKTLGRVAWDFMRAFRALHFVGPCVTVFGSARTEEGTPHYELARKMAAVVAEMGFTVMTGAGPGIMEAANRGAREAGGRSVGCAIELPFEASSNPYLDREVTLRYFFVRKVILLKYSYAFIVMPGGVGTMDEMFETVTLIQTKKIRNFPIVLMGKDYWAPLMEFVRHMADEGTISPEDLDLIYFTDDVEAAADHIRCHAAQQFGLRRRYIPKSLPILGEKALD